MKIGSVVNRPGHKSIHQFSVLIMADFQDRSVSGMFGHVISGTISNAASVAQAADWGDWSLYAGYHLRRHA